MLRARVIPCLLLKNKRLVKTKKFKNPIYIGDPMNAVKIFNEKETDELVFIDINASNAKKGPDFELIKEITTECFMPFAYGGGIENIQQVDKLFALGVEKVIFGKTAFLQPEIVKEAIAIYGAQSIVAVMDVKQKWLSKNKSVYINNGKKNTNFSPVEYALFLQKLGVGEIILQNIDLDGTRNGLDTELIKTISEQLTIPLIALGGCGKKKDILTGLQAGASGIAAGTLFTLREPHDAVLITYLSEEEINNLSNVLNEKTT